MQRSGGSFEPLFDPGPGDDRAAVAEPDAGAKGTVVIPEGVELRVERANLLANLGVVLSGKRVPELGTILAQALDLIVDLAEGCHVRSNAGLVRFIPQEYPSSSSRSSSIPK
jgi:hypothetical protein